MDELMDDVSIGDLGEFCINVDDFIDFLTSITNNSMLFPEDIKHIKNNAEGIPDLPNNSAFTATGLYSLIINLENKLDAEYFSVWYSSAYTMVSTLAVIKAEIVDIETMKLSDDSIMKVLLAEMEISTFSARFRDGTLSERERELIADYVDEEGNITDFEGLMAHLQKYFEENTDYDSDDIKTVAKFFKNVSTTYFNDQLKPIITERLALGSSGMELLKLAEGIVLDGDPGWVKRGSSLVKKAIENIFKESNDDLFGEGAAAEAAAKRLFDFGLKEIGGVFILNAAVALITDAVDQGDFNLAKDLTTATYSALTFAIGNMIGGPLGVAASIALDCIGSKYINTKFAEWEHEKRLQYFSEEDLKMLEFDSSKLGILDDDRVPPGTTVFDAERELRDLGISEEAIKYLSSHLLEYPYKEDSIVPDAELRAILDYYAGIPPEMNSFSWTDEEWEKYYKMLELLNSGDPEILAYTELIKDNYYVDQKVDNTKKEDKNYESVPSERPDSVS